MVGSCSGSTSLATDVDGNIQLGGKRDAFGYKRFRLATVSQLAAIGSVPTDPRVGCSPDPRGFCRGP